MQLAYSQVKKVKKLSKAQIFAKILVEKWKVQDAEKAEQEFERIKKHLL